MRSVLVVLELYVTECRLDVPLNLSACDASTQQAYTVELDGTLPTDPLVQIFDGADELQVRRWS
ncbi:MAG TPA: hypothetical protein VMX12_06405 [Acidimicrobiia bacterium]|nr:hypothetical protein [Acidimicrobiia bacterium]